MVIIYFSFTADHYFSLITNQLLSLPTLWRIKKRRKDKNALWQKEKKEENVCPQTKKKEKTG